MHIFLSIKELIAYFSGYLTKCSVYIPPGMCSGIAPAAIPAGKDFAAPVVKFFLWHIIRQSYFLFLEGFFNALRNFSSSTFSFFFLLFFLTPD